VSASKALAALVFLVVFGAVLGGPGCVSYGTSFTYSFDPRFAPDEKAAIVAAMNDWSEAVLEGSAASPLSFVEDPTASGEGSNQIRFVASTGAEMEARRPNAPRGLLGWNEVVDAREGSSWVWFALDRLQGSWGSTNLALLSQIAEHEVGHSLGLQHTGPGTIMCGNVGCMAVAVECQDVAQYSALRGEPSAPCE
jgi:hypothetical protein